MPNIRNRIDRLRWHRTGTRGRLPRYTLPLWTERPTALKSRGVATTRVETAQRAAVEIGCDFYTDNYRELLARQDIDAVDICTPNNSHHENRPGRGRGGKTHLLRKAAGDECGGSGEHGEGRPQRRRKGADDL